MVFAATAEHGPRAGLRAGTVERTAAAAGIAKTTIYRRRPAKGALIMGCLLDTLGPVPLAGGSRAEIMSSVVRWTAGEIGDEPVLDDDVNALVEVVLT